MMKTEQQMAAAFFLNLLFSLFELIGGAMIGSTAVVSDAVHDAGDAVSIGISWLLEKKSKKQPDDTYTYGYARYAAVGALVTTTTLIVGSVVMIVHAVKRLIVPVEIDYSGMMVFAVFGVCVNGCATLLTHGGDSLNQKAVNWHMLEDVLGWGVVLVGAVVMRFTDWTFIDPLMSVGVSLFILFHAVGHMKDVADLFLEKTPRDRNVGEIKACLETVDGVFEAHHLHVWSIDGQYHAATVHIVTDRDPRDIKAAVRDAFCKNGIDHVTIETETSGERCTQTHCGVACQEHRRHHHAH